MIGSSFSLLASLISLIEASEYVSSLVLLVMNPYLNCIGCLMIPYGLIDCIYFLQYHICLESSMNAIL
jgi:hypothetical protein